MPSDGSSSSTSSTNNPSSHIPLLCPYFTNPSCTSGPTPKSFTLIPIINRSGTLRAAFLGLYLGDEDTWLMNPKGMTGMVTASHDAEAQGTTCFHQVNFLKAEEAASKAMKDITHRS